MRVIITAYAATFLAGQVFGHPTSVPSRRALQQRVVDFNSFRLSTTTEYSNVTDTTKIGLSNVLVRRQDSYLDTAIALLKQVALDAKFRLVDDHYIGTNGISHVNFKQTVHGLDIDNADFNVNVSQ
jgi:extracellular elastinolytic metalloproteinase